MTTEEQRTKALKALYGEPGGELDGLAYKSSRDGHYYVTVHEDAQVDDLVRDIESALQPAPTSDEVRETVCYFDKYISALDSQSGAGNIVMDDEELGQFAMMTVRADKVKSLIRAAASPREDLTALLDQMAWALKEAAPFIGYSLKVPDRMKSPQIADLLDKALAAYRKHKETM